MTEYDSLFAESESMKECDSMSECDCVTKCDCVTEYVIMAECDRHSFDILIVGSV